VHTIGMEALRGLRFADGAILYGMTDEALG
jgi:hypothetical protein